MTNRAFTTVAVTLLALIGVAVWQFHSLVLASPYGAHSAGVAKSTLPDDLMGNRTLTGVRR